MNITFIGMSGVGKSIIGKELAKKLNYKFIDIDELIKEKIGLKLQQIIDEFGEKRFLEIEEEIILGLGNLDNCVISPGGSVIYSEKAMEFLKKNSIIIFLNAPFKSIQKRAVNLENRGIVKLEADNFKDIFKKRLPLYKKYADNTLEIKNFDIDEILKKIIEKVGLCNLSIDE